MNLLTTIPQSIALTITPQGPPQCVFNLFNQTCLYMLIYIYIYIYTQPFCHEQNAIQGQFFKCSWTGLNLLQDWLPYYFTYRGRIVMHTFPKTINNVWNVNVFRILTWVIVFHFLKQQLLQHMYFPLSLTLYIYIYIYIYILSSTDRLFCYITILRCG